MPSLKQKCAEWYKNAADNEKELLQTILAYEKEYFDDMTFKPDSIMSPFVKYPVQDNNGVVSFNNFALPPDLSSISHMNCRFYIGNIEKDFTAGAWNKKEKTLTILPEYSKDKVTILHEMIHIYESALDKYIPSLRDALTLTLYVNIKDTLPDIDARLITRTNFWVADSIIEIGGSHGVLFFLKSIDLDLRCGYELGTVFRYAKEE